MFPTTVRWAKSSTATVTALQAIFAIVVGDKIADGILSIPKFKTDSCVVIGQPIFNGHICRLQVKPVLGIFIGSDIAHDNAAHRFVCPKAIGVAINAATIVMIV